MALQEGRKRVLVVDDEPAIRDMLRGFFEAKGYEALTAAGGDEAVKLIGQQRPHAVLLDLCMPGLSGLDTLARIKELDRRLPVVVVTGHGTVDAAVAAMRLGAEDFVAKPVRLAALLEIVERVAPGGPEGDGGQLLLASRASLAEMMGPSAAVRRVCEQVAQVAGTGLTVLLHGETGAGKSLVARAVHDLSERAARRLVRVDCGAIPDTLIESELFGHERGAFTGAVERKGGYFERAHEGTLFLDEVANLSEAMMRKLLCALEDRQVYRVGGKEPIPVDIRVVAASNQDLQRLVERGAFRRDLFHRLNEFAIEIPPLRKRKEDIAHLAQRFLAQASEELGRRVQGVSPQAMELLYGYEWPGNVRELRNVIRRAVLLAEDTVNPDHVRAASARCAVPGSELHRAAERPAVQPSNLDQVLAGQWSLKDITRECVRQVEQSVIAAVLERTGGNRSQAARLLKVDYKTLYYKAKELGAGGGRSIDATP
ncbi:MAG: sigma-54-dependent Fis family transcriptional regulator [Planctomycetes bacterium]|nr:sigma-54-dependent Fis family transcriptional regulator [Planctomycetota bacterium]